MAKSPYQTFGTDKTAEKQGIVLDYGDFRFRVARAGGSNTRYNKRLEALSKPYRRQMETDTLSEEVGKEIIHRVFAETVILSAETNMADDGEEADFQPGLINKSGELVEATTEVLVTLFNDLPDLFQDIKAQATNFSLYRQMEQDADAKN